MNIETSLIEAQKDSTLVSLKDFQFGQNISNIKLRAKYNSKIKIIKTVNEGRPYTDILFLKASKSKYLPIADRKKVAAVRIISNCKIYFILKICLSIISCIICF